MRLLTDDPTAARAERASWAARWLSAAPFRGTPVRVLDLAMTSLATFTEADVAFYQRTGRWPEYDRMALDPRWGFPERGPVAPDGTVARRDFHDWRATGSGKLGSTGRPVGRPLLLDYETARRCRQLRSYPEAVGLFGYSVPKFPSYPSFRQLALGQTYWWVQAGDPSWMGWSWTHEEATNVLATA